MAQGSAQNKIQPVDEFKQPVSRAHPLAVMTGEDATPGQSIRSAMAPVTQLLQEIRELLLDIRYSLIEMKEFTGSKSLGDGVSKSSKASIIDERRAR